MKKILSLTILCLFVSLGLNAQTFQMTSQYATGDTISNTGTKACSLKVVHTYKQVTIQALITKISGTVAGTVTLQGSIDGTNFVTLDTAALQTDGPSTFTATNVATQNKLWIVNNAPYLWFKLSYTGSGTMAATLKGYLLPREQQ